MSKVLITSNARERMVVSYNTYEGKDPANGQMIYMRRCVYVVASPGATAEDIVKEFNELKDRHVLITPEGGTLETLTSEDDNVVVQGTVGLIEWLLDQKFNRGRSILDIVQNEFIRSRDQQEKNKNG